MKGRKHREAGGVNDAEEDVKTKTPKRSYTGTNAPDSGTEAEELKKGGRAKKKHGGKAEMKVEGKEKHHLGRKPRKSGGRAGSENSPMTSSHSGKHPAGRSVMSESMD